MIQKGLKLLFVEQPRLSQKIRQVFALGSKREARAILIAFCCSWFLAVGCSDSKNESRSNPAKPVIGIAFETLQTEFWVAGYAAIKDECKKRGFTVMESVADGDANRQL